MRRYMRNITAAFVSLFVLASFTAEAQLPTEGVWSGTYNITSAVTVNLTGNVVVTGNVNIKSGGRLTINSNGAVRTITNGVSGTRTTAMFETTGTGKLYMNGEAGKEIVLKGNAGLVATFDSDGFLENYPEATNKFSDKAVVTNTSGTVELKYVNITDVYEKRASGYELYDGAAFRHASGSSKLSNCKISNCWAFIGPAIYATHNSTGTLVVENCEVFNCYARGTVGYGGMIRSIGNSGTAVRISNTSVHHNSTAGKGGGILFNGSQTSASCDIRGCEVYMNHAGKGGGGIMGSGNVMFTTALTKVHDNFSAESGGGVYLEMYGGGTGPSSVVVVNQDLSQYVEIYDNESPVGGGVTIAINVDRAPTLTTGSSYNVIVSGASIHDNTADGDGGGIYYLNNYTGSDYVFTTTFNSGSVYENGSGNCGGGVYIKNSPLFVVNGGDIYSNTSVKEGAGVYVSGKVNFNNGSISKNVSSTNGGGLYVHQGDMAISNGTIDKNEAVNGAGVYLADGNVSFTDGIVKDNVAGNDGAGLWVNGNVEVYGGSIASNTATGKGGGVFVTGGSFLLDGGTISVNKADAGAGVWANQSINISGGRLISNKATTKGGGLYAQGSGVTVSFTNGQIQENEAYDGAGAYITDGVQMLYNNGGFLRGNMAGHRGGGVFLAEGPDASHNTTLDFNFSPSLGDKLGFFGNTAANVTGGAGDDIYAESGNTQVTVPDIADMTLEGYDHKNSKLRWYEDYENNDPRYADGTYVVTTSGYVPARYRVNRDNYDAVYAVADIAGNTAYYGKYLALTMGYEFRGINIRRKGLEPGENAIYHVQVYDISSVLVRDQYVVVKGTDNEWDGSQIQIEGIEAGSKVIVEETSWTWYNTDKSDAVMKDEKIVDAGKGLVVFSFQNNHVSTVLLHDEDIKDNSLK